MSSTSSRSAERLTRDTKNPRSSSSPLSLTWSLPGPGLGGGRGEHERRAGVVETLLPGGPSETEAQHRAVAANVVAGEQVLAVADVKEEDVPRETPRGESMLIRSAPSGRGRHRRAGSGSPRSPSV